MSKSTFNLFVLFCLCQAGCHRPQKSMSTVQISWDQPSRQSIQGPYLTQISGTSSFGARGISSLSEMDCIAVLISEDSGSDSCSTKNGQTFTFSSSAGFSGPGVGLSLEVEPGPSRTIRILGVNRLNANECPLLNSLDRLSISNPRIIFESTRELVPGDNNINVLPDFSGPEIVSCRGSKISEKSTLCDRTGGTSVVGYIVVHLANASTLAEFEARFSSLGLTRSGSWTAINSHHYVLSGGLTASDRKSVV